MRQCCRKSLNRCDECRAEFEALNATLRVTSRLREMVAPPEDYWTGYHTLGYVRD